MQDKFLEEEIHPWTSNEKMEEIQKKLGLSEWFKEKSLSKKKKKENGFIEWLKQNQNDSHSKFF